MIKISQFAQSYSSPYYNDTANSALSGDAGAALIFFAIVLMFLLIAVTYAVHSYLLGRIFKKAGVPTWKAWVPIYNQWILLELGDQKGYWAVFSLIPIVNIVSAVFGYIAMYHIGLKLSKSETFVLWAIFLPIVWLIWLAVDDSTWQRKKAAKPLASTK